MIYIYCFNYAVKKKGVEDQATKVWSAVRGADSEWQCVQ